jgi:hypothetical protein
MRKHTTLAAAICGSYTLARIVAFRAGPLLMYPFLLVVLYRPGQPVVKLADIFVLFYVVLVGRVHEFYLL